MADDKWTVVNKKGEVVGTATSKDSARKVRDKHDIKYGGVQHSIRPPKQSDALIKFEIAKSTVPPVSTKETQRKQDIDSFFSKLKNKHSSTRDARLQQTLARREHKLSEPDLPRVKPVYNLSPQSKETWETNVRKKINDPGRQAARDERRAHEKRERASGRGPGLRDYLATDFLKGWNKIKAIKPGDLPDLD